MSLFRDEHPVLGPNVKVDMSNSAVTAYHVKIPPFEYASVGYNATTTYNCAIFVQPLDTTYGQYRVVNATYSLDSSAAAGAILDLQTVVSGNTLAQGVSLLSANVNINTATLKTPTAFSLASPLTSLAAGQKVVVVPTGTMTGLTGLTVFITLERV